MAKRRKTSFSQFEGKRPAPKRDPADGPAVDNRSTRTINADGSEGPSVEEKVIGDMREHRRKVLQGG
jgi:hypothetical protein